MGWVYRLILLGHEDVHCSTVPVLEAPMVQELLYEDDFAGLPDEPEARFLALQKICRQRLAERLDQEGGNFYDSQARSDYMNIVASAAAALGIEGIELPSQLNNLEAQLSFFFDNVTRVITPLRLRQSSARDPHSVRLSSHTRGSIQLQVNKLREIISSSNLRDDRKEALYEKLDELLDEVNRPRVRFGVVMAAMACIGLGVASGTSFLADAPEALATIQKLIGHDKAKEVEEVERLGPPPKPKALPAPKTNVGSGGYGRDLDDEIPF